MIKQIPAKGFFPKDYTLSVGNETIEICKVDAPTRSWKSFFRGVLLKFNYKGQAFTVDILQSDEIITIVPDGKNGFKRVIKLSEQFEWESKKIISAEYQIKIKEGINRTIVIAEHLERKIFELHGEEFKWRHLLNPLEAWAIGEETRDFIFERDCSILLYCIHWLNYGRLSH